MAQPFAAGGLMHGGRREDHAGRSVAPTQKVGHRAHPAPVNVRARQSGRDQSAKGTGHVAAARKAVMP
jgi:hypothetical protein